jgi:hypothetical protein
VFAYVVLPGYLVNHIFNLSSCEVSAEVAVLLKTDFVFKVVNDVPKGSGCGDVVSICTHPNFDSVSVGNSQPIIVCLHRKIPFVLTENPIVK